MSRLYKVHEFAELAGVTVKTLHHYDRLGLLKTMRAESGYRLYRERDLERLEQIVALKFLGLPLERIRAVLDRAAFELPDALRFQRKVLEEKQRLLARALDAIREAEGSIAAGGPGDAAILRKIIEVIGMQEGIDEMKRYYGAAAWVKRRRHYEEWPSKEWKSLYRDIEAALEEGPDGARARGLAIRWVLLVEEETGGDAEIRIGMFGAWRDRHYWPPALLRRMQAFRLDEIWEYAGSAIVRLRGQYYDDSAWTEVAGVTRGGAWRDLFLDVTAALAEDAAGEKGQALAVRWQEVDPAHERAQALVARWKELGGEQAAGGDAVRRQVALFTLEKVLGFIGKATFVAYRAGVEARS